MGFLTRLMSSDIKEFSNNNSFIINGVIHKLYITDMDLDSFNKEMMKLYGLLHHYYNREEELNKALSDASIHKYSPIYRVLLHYSAVAIPTNLNTFLETMQNDELIVNSDNKRLQNLIVNIGSIVDYRVIDVCMGRFYRSMYNEYWIPGKGISPNDIKRINATYECVPWCWILPHYQNAISNNSMYITSPGELEIFRGIKK